MKINVLELIEEIGKVGLKFDMYFKGGFIWIVFANSYEAEELNISFGSVDNYNGYQNAIRIDPTDL